jgi:hypothetical protein
MSNFYSLPAPTTSPLASPTGITVTATAYPITVGAGGAGGSGGPTSPAQIGVSGSNSVFQYNYISRWRRRRWNWSYRNMEHQVVLEEVVVDGVVVHNQEVQEIHLQ